MGIPAGEAGRPAQSSNLQWPRRKIDHFILAKLDQNKLQPSPAADKRTLIRRAYFDLIGLPLYEDVQALSPIPRSTLTSS